MTENSKIGNKGMDTGERIGDNLNKLRNVMGWSQKTMARLTGVVEPTMTDYLRGRKIPKLEYLLDVCSMEQFKDKGLYFDINDLLSPTFDPELAQRINRGSGYRSANNTLHDDFIGSYICYFYDQTKSVNDQDPRMSRELRYGVLSVYDDCNSITGEKRIRVYAAFYKESEFGYALNAKRELDSIFKSIPTAGERNASLSEFYVKLGETVGVYEGDVSFSNQHAFISINSPVYNDTALMILYSPQKRTDSDYLGGIGSIASVAHGRMHMPTAQKIIISRFELRCSAEEIGDHLSFYYAPVSQSEEARAIVEMCVKLYGKDSNISEFLDENDKKAIIENRLGQLVRNYIGKSFCCVSGVSEEDDKKVYSLIKRYADTGREETK